MVLGHRVARGFSRAERLASQKSGTQIGRIAMHATPALPQASKQMRIRGQPPALAPRIMSRTKIYQKIFRLCLGVSGFLSLACHTAQAASSYTLSGSYACSTSVNFGGFFTRQTNTGDGTTAIGSLSILKFTYYQNSYKMNFI